MSDITITETIELVSNPNTPVHQQVKDLGDASDKPHAIVIHPKGIHSLLDRDARFIYYTNDGIRHSGLFLVEDQHYPETPTVLTEREYRLYVETANVRLGIRKALQLMANGYTMSAVTVLDGVL